MHYSKARSLSLDGRGITVHQVRHPAVSLVLTYSARQPAASSTDCDLDRLASMTSLCYSALSTRIALFLMR